MPTKLICCAILFFCVAFQGVAADTMHDNQQYLGDFPDDVREAHSLFFEPLDDTQVSIAPEISAIFFSTAEALRRLCGRTSGSVLPLLMAIWSHPWSHLYWS